MAASCAGAGDSNGDPCALDADGSACADSGGSCVYTAAACLDFGGYDTVGCANPVDSDTCWVRNNAYYRLRRSILYSK